MKALPIFHKNNLKKQQGFTLLELIIVVAILAILVSFVAPSFLDEPDKARVTKTKVHIQQITSALNRYYLNNYNFPTTEQGLEALVSKPEGEPAPKNWGPNPYLPEVPKDGWENDFLYISPGEQGKYDLISYGRDGKEGGSEFDTDITNHNSKK